MATAPKMRIAHTALSNATQAVQALFAEIEQPSMALVIFFCSNNYDLQEMALAIQRDFKDTPVIGCTTAGEIGPLGCQENSLVGVSFPKSTCQAVTGRIEHLQEFNISQGQSFAQTLLQQLEFNAPENTITNSFAFLMIDGLSIREEIVARTLQNALGSIPTFGGSAGDGLQFKKTYVYHDGQFREDCAVLALVSTQLPFKLFKTQHFATTNERLVVTEADANNRIVKEINGLPAAQEYARLLGVTVDQLDPTRFATSPVVVVIEGADYVRSIQKVNPDDSLTFYCAIEEGLVLRLAHGVNLIENLRQTFDQIHAEIGTPQLVIGCDCILRNVEIKKDQLTDQVSTIFQENNAVGFATYGEQFGGVHVNQTLTGIAFGDLERDDV